MSLQTCKIVPDDDGYLFVESIHTPYTAAQLSEMSWEEAEAAGNGATVRSLQIPISSGSMVRSDGVLVFHDTAVSDDGTQVVFTEVRVGADGVSSGYVTYNRDAGTYTVEYEFLYAWTPDGRPVFRRKATQEILVAAHIANSSGGEIQFDATLGIVPMPSGEAYVGEVYCSELSLYIQVISGDNFGIYKAPIDGSGGFELTAEFGYDYSPTFQLNYQHTSRRPARGPWMLSMVAGTPFLINIDSGAISGLPSGVTPIGTDGRNVICKIPDGEECDVLVYDMAISSDFGENLIRVLHVAFQDSQLSELFPVIGDPGTGHADKVFITSKWIEGLPALVEAGDDGALFYLLPYAGGELLGFGVGWISPAGNQPEFWTAFIRCTEKP